MTPSKQSSAKRCSGVISTLTRRIGTSSLWCALNAGTKNIFEKPDLRGKSTCASINKAGYGHLKMGNSNMQSLILNKPAAFWRIWRRSLLQTFSPHAHLKGPESEATVTTKMEFFDQVISCLGILEMQTNALVAEARDLYRE